MHLNVFCRIYSLPISSAVYIWTDKYSVVFMQYKIRLAHAKGPAANELVLKVMFLSMRLDKEVSFHEYGLSLFYTNIECTIRTILQW